MKANWFKYQLMYLQTGHSWYAVSTSKELVRSHHQEYLGLVHCRIGLERTNRARYLLPQIIRAVWTCPQLIPYPVLIQADIRSNQIGVVKAIHEVKESVCNLLWCGCNVVPELCP